MCRVNPLLFLAIILNRRSNAEEGIVLEYLPKGDIKLLFSIHENNLHDGKYELVNDWIQQDDQNFVKLYCNKLEINTKSESVMWQLRATLVTKDDVELESFRVTDCKKETLLAGIFVTQSTDEELKKEYQIKFKDDKNDCQKRTYLVEITHNDGNPVVAVTRSRPELITADWDCPISGNVKGLVSSWYDDGTTNDHSLSNDYMTVYRFECENCWVLCGKAKNGDLFVDLIVSGAPIDRLMVSSCEKKSLQKSIKFDFHVQVHERKKNILMNYMENDGSCFRRRYEYDIQAHKDRMLMKAFVNRNAPTENDNCVVNKEFGMTLAKKTQYHFGRITSRDITTGPIFECSDRKLNC